MYAAYNSQTEPEECLKPLMTSPPSYSENLICPSELNFYTFVCDASSQYISWNFNSEIEKTYFGNSSIFFYKREYRGHTRDYDFHIALPLSEGHANDVDNFTMRSTLTIHAHNLTQFPVNCSTHCGQERKNQSAVYRVAGGWSIVLPVIIRLQKLYFLELPKLPRKIHFYDPSKNKNNNCTGPKAVIKWDPPENSKWFPLSHYEYKYYETEKFGDETEIVKRFGRQSYWLDRSPSKEYYFEVYAVDKCGQRGEIALITIPAEEN